jgi:NAD(P)-dependent dehydrogenase (short-subunit alcohol dehydrogenase family)
VSASFDGAIAIVSGGPAWARLIDEVAARHGRLDYVFNNAGVSVTGEVRDLEPAHRQPTLAGLRRLLNRRLIADLRRVRGRESRAFALPHVREALNKSILDSFRVGGGGARRGGRGGVRSG